jgi:hypothetical protein
MTNAFHPAADWPTALPGAAERLGAAAMQALRHDAWTEIARTLPAASQLHAVRAWLGAAAAEALLHELIDCMFAADCWNARRVSPRRQRLGEAWHLHFGQRLQAARQRLSEVLARWAVLERIPVQWIPPERLKAELRSAVATAGFQLEVTGLRLFSPTPGGTEWVSRRCGGSVDELAAHARRGPVAAVLHWPHRTTAAVVVADGDGLKAFAPVFGADGAGFEATTLTGCTVFPPRDPPPSWWHRCVRALGLQEWWWHWQRARRIRRGVNPLAAP